jgi:broad specificity phosphatase PhoE
MTPAVLWMRHGTCADGLHRPQAHARPDSPLTTQGAVEAEAAARHLRSGCEPPTLVVPSSLRRARQTASITARVLGAQLAEPVAAFAEWHAPHCVLGRAPDEYPYAYRAWRWQRAHEPDSVLPGGESLHAFTNRVRDAIAAAGELATDHSRILIVSHRLLIGAVAALHLGRHTPADIFDCAKGFRLDPAHLWAPPRESADEQGRSPP